MISFDDVTKAQEEVSDAELEGAAGGTIRVLQRRENDHS